MTYISLTIKGVPDEDAMNLLVAGLYELSFESFNEEEHKLDAYIPEESFDQDAVESLLIRHPFAGQLEWDWCNVQDKNWNEEWEKDYKPVLVAGVCYVRAPFHERRDEVKFDIVIEPKMSFGTAHHETTALMIETMLGLDLKGKVVIDMGCGTAVLAILANKMGAAHVYAIDNNDWAFNNAVENVKKNNADHVEVLLGDAETLNDKHCEVMLANINRNVLLEDMEAYMKALGPGGLLVMSGFLKRDSELIKQTAEKYHVKLIEERKMNDWVAATFKY